MGMKDSVGTHATHIFMKCHLHPSCPYPMFTSINLQVLWCLKHVVQLNVVLRAQGVSATFVVTHIHIYPVHTCF